MTIIKSFSVDNGDTFYIDHNSDNFTVIDCHLNGERSDEIIDEITFKGDKKGIRRFISTHPDNDHIAGIEKLDNKRPILNFYVVNNEATKNEETISFQKYKELRDNKDKAFYLYKDCSIKWMNAPSNERGSAGLSVLWPDTSNALFQEELLAAKDGVRFNNICPVIRYSLKDGGTCMWIGDLETEFMESITEHIQLTKTNIIFAPHHGRESGKIPNSWLDKLQPDLIIIGEAPSRHLNYYTGYKKITQNSAKDITLEFIEGRINIYVGSEQYVTDKKNKFKRDSSIINDNYLGYIEV
ncbi:MBL fold metallo-hydrolase [Halomonas elongata]|uniref:MBL fold metallo-hydrolase n=1 Tax=Halomonas elongata TaxID=2746 RepID=UPI00255AA8F3|nr:MBL fold metallo-hydrolase [Halomonas elongata]MDL4861721.1 MBL fold metallo-hydrolase [Halomonas elongata]